MPNIAVARLIIEGAEAIIGRMPRAERVALLDEHFPEVPAKELSALVGAL